MFPGSAADPRLLLVAHGTRSATGVAMIGDLAQALRGRIPEVDVAFVDVLGPTPSDVLRGHRDPTVLVPAFLASGYHVRSDVPAHVSASGHPHVVISSALGPDDALARLMFRRLVAAGWCPGDTVVLAAAGSSDPLAQADVNRTGRLLSAAIGAPVHVGYASPPAGAAAKAVPRVVARLRRRTGGRVFIATYLLAEGLFYQRLLTAEADAVTPVLGVDTAVIDVVEHRYRQACAVARAHSA